MSYFELREPLSDDEHNVLLALRKSARESSGTDNAQSTGRLFGVFRCGRRGSRAIGSVRVAEVFAERQHAWGRSSLPLARRVEPQVPIYRMVHAVLRKHGLLIEAEDIVLERRFRSRRLAHFVAEAVTALYGLGFTVPCALACLPEEARFYQTLGFRQVFKGATVDGESKRVLLYGVVGRLTQPEVRERLTQMLAAYGRSGAIAFHPDKPGNFVPDVVHPDSGRSSLRLALRQAA